VIRIGSALFNADHARLGDELRRVEAAGIDFVHFDVFDGYAVADQAFPARTIKALRTLSRLPFEVHLSAREPERFLRALADAGVDLVFLPAETTLLLYEAIFAVRELGMKPGLCLALGTDLGVLEATLPMVDSVLLLGRVTGEGSRGRDFNRLLIDRVAHVRRRIDAMGLAVDLQAAGGLETASCVEVCRAGATSLPIGAALHRESDMAAYVAMLRQAIAGESVVPASPERMGGTPMPRKTWNVLVASRSFGKNCPEVLEAMKAAACAFLPVSWEKAPMEQQLIDSIGPADVLISGTEPVTQRVLDAAPELKVISKHGVGYENIDLDAARRRGVPVCIAGGAIADSVADLAMGLILAIARQIPQGDASIRAGGWARLVGPELRGKTLGIVGLGQIGKGLARRAKGFGMDLLAFDAVKDEAFAASWGVSFADTLEELLSRSDFVSLHAPVTPQTRQMMSSQRLSLMKPTAYLVNTARGELVDEAALCQALLQRKIAGAAIDVFAKEPPGDSPLLKLDNFIATSHIGGQTPEGLRRMGQITAENALRVLRGEKPLYQVG
jgi:D-3-phosphoglycerate dehydrogenase